MTNPTPLPSPQRFKRVRELFELALSLPTAQREPFVRAQAARDDALAKEVLTLLGRTDADTAAFAGAARRDLGAAVYDDKLPSIPGYRIDTELGRGAMGVVFGGVQLESGREVAIKFPHGHLTDPDVIQRFRREARAMAALDHPRAILLLHADLDGQRPYLVMERMPGRTLKDEVEEGGPMPVDDAVRHTVGICEGLDAAHELGILHRDVKPANCYLDAHGEVRIGDFGLSHEQQSDLHLTHIGDVLGTPLFMSPEQARGDDIDERADVYSVCATLHYLLTGAPPITASTNSQLLSRIQTQPPRRLRLDLPDAPVALERVLLRGMAKEAKNRFGDMQELRAALQRVLPLRCGPAILAARFAAITFDGLLYALVLDLLVDAIIPPRYLPAWSEIGIPLAVYVALTTAVLGGTLGQRVFGLEVVDVRTRLRPGPGLAAWRSLVFLTPMIALLCFLLSAPAAWLLMGGLILPILSPILVVPLLGLSMRQASGYRGLHEWLSRTAVEPTPIPTPRLPRATHASFIGAGRLIGDYQVGADSTPNPACLAFDRGLRRQVVLQAAQGASRAEVVRRRTLERRTRSRWVDSIRDGEAELEVYLLPHCTPLRAACDDMRGDWVFGRALITSLAAELAASRAETTLPGTLYTDQIAVRADGTALLLDTPPREWRLDGAEPFQTDMDGGWAFLRSVMTQVLPHRGHLPMHARTILARLDTQAGDSAAWQDLHAALQASRGLPVTLDGRLRQGQACLRGLWVASLTWVVLGSHYVLDNIRFSWLQGAEVGFRSVLPELPKDSDLQLAVASTHKEVVAMLAGWYSSPYGIVCPPMDLGHTVGVGASLSAGISSCEAADDFRFLWQSVLLSWEASLRTVIFSTTEQILMLLILVSWPLMLRSGLSCRLLGTEVVDVSGQPAGRLRCLWRTLLLVTPPVGLAFAAFHAQGWTPADVSWSHGLVMAANAALAATLLLGLFARGRMPHEAMSGTWLVPR